MLFAPTECVRISSSSFSMSHHFTLTNNRKYCKVCPQSYAKTVSTMTLNDHVRTHAKAPARNDAVLQKVNNAAFVPELTKIFSALGWSLQHVDRPEFNQLVKLLRSSNCAVPCRQTLSTRVIEQGETERHKLLEKVPFLERMHTRYTHCEQCLRTYIHTYTYIHTRT